MTHTIPRRPQDDPAPVPTPAEQIATLHSEVEALRVQVNRLAAELAASRETAPPTVAPADLEALRGEIAAHLPQLRKYR